MLSPRTPRLSSACRCAFLGVCFFQKLKKKKTWNINIQKHSLQHRHPQPPLLLPLPLSFFLLRVSSTASPPSWSTEASRNRCLVSSPLTSLQRPTTLTPPAARRESTEFQQTHFSNVRQSNPTLPLSLSLFATGGAMIGVKRAAESEQRQQGGKPVRALRFMIR